MFHGSMVALVTPMQADGSIDFDGLARLVEFHVENKTDAIVSMGTTGESATLSKKEHTSVVRRTVELVGGRIPVIAGTGSNCTREATFLTRAAMEAGADACLLVTPYYIKPTQEGLYQHYRSIAEAVAIPQILYNVPGRTAVDLLPETVARLADIPNIVGIKEATGDLQRAKELLERCGDRLDLYSGDDFTTREFILQGGKGSISVTANVVPRAMRDMCAAALAGDTQRAAELDGPLVGLHENLFLEANPIPVKWAVTRLGLIEPALRLPLTELSEQYQNSVADAMCQAGVSL
ncbi:4-hydroxy-tetrahydrodipicolinate synthase [hydrothermal vent metagenome]|uniref:4-hydroxy-tetrahydrodipicolinate synthase n=1 Tax=hydrothermal vent metagenome TaxID=652676 RepID=A0A3B0ZLW9_9ZZZZ